MRILKICCLLTLFHIAWAASGQEANPVITLLFTGDIMGHDMQISSAYNDSTGTYSYDSVFKYVSPIISAADIAAGNLEVTLGGPPYKGYPAFSSPDALAEACKNAGFDVLFTANNHAADRGSKGIARTIRVLDSLQIKHTGTWTDSLAHDTLSPLIISKGGITLALLNYTYGTNGIVVRPPSIVSYIDSARVSDDIKAATARGADPVIIFVHWGTEYDTLPDRQQLKDAEIMMKAGADIIIGSHPHVLQPMTASADSTGLTCPIVWSMGNFISNQRFERRDGGAMVMIEMMVRDSITYIIEAGYILTWVYVPVKNGKREFYILPCSQFEDRPGFFSKQADYEKMMNFVTGARRMLGNLSTGFSELVYADGMWVMNGR